MRRHRDGSEPFVSFLVDESQCGSLRRQYCKRVLVRTENRERKRKTGVREECEEGSLDLLVVMLVPRRMGAVHVIDGQNPRLLLWQEGVMWRGRGVY